ncbi:MAG: GntR family transcriptional regulator [Rhodospirillales bacterium]|nr:GntR family transcriptional regulator [Rhodospirillales bacterium]
MMKKAAQTAVHKRGGRSPAIRTRVRQSTTERGRLAAAMVFDRVRDMILSLSLTPGMVLSRADLARRFGVSQTPVRDALMRLAAEGLVEIFPQHATVVSLIDLPAARQAHFLRRSLELEVVRSLAISHDPGAISTLRACLDSQREYAVRRDLKAFSDSDRLFHRIMYEAAGVPDMWQLMHQNCGQLDRLRRLNLPDLCKMETVLADHKAILDAIDDRQPEIAQAYLRKHLAGTLANIEALSARFPEYMRQEAADRPERRAEAVLTL